MKNVFEAVDARQKQARKRSLCLINEHFESVFNTAAATQIVFQQPVKRKAGISPKMALRLAKAFDASPESWLNQQMQYDLWVAEQNLGELNIEKLKTASPVLSTDA